MFAYQGSFHNRSAEAMFAALRQQHLEQIARNNEQRKQSYIEPIEGLQAQLAEIEKDFGLFFPDFSVEGRWAKAAFEKIQLHINEARRLADNTKINVEALVSGQG